MSVKTSPRRIARRAAAKMIRDAERVLTCHCRTEGWNPYCRLHG